MDFTECLLFIHRLSMVLFAKLYKKKNLYMIGNP